MRPLPGERVGASSVVPAGSPYARPTMSTATDLDGRVALVSGGARGLGRGVTDGLLAAGARVAVCGRSQPDELPAGARFFGADVRDAGAVDGLVAAVAEHYGRLDIAVNNAGGSPVAEAATAAPAFSTAIVTLNLLAPLLVSQAVNRVMQGQDEGGAIVNIGSLTGPSPSPGTAAYGAAKAGLVDLTIAKLVRGFGADIRRHIVGTLVTSWGSNPYIRGGYAIARPGRAGSRDRLIAGDISDRVFLAGEACHPYWFATAHGAYLTGIDRAHRALSAIGHPAAPPDPLWLPHGEAAVGG